MGWGCGGSGEKNTKPGGKGLNGWEKVASLVGLVVKPGMRAAAR